MAVRKCDLCKKEYHVYDTDAGTFLEHFCSEKCEEIIEQRIDKYVKKITEEQNG